MPLTVLSALGYSLLNRLNESTWNK
jgi:hypothetical protein